jgi:hypothetical protein
MSEAQQGCVALLDEGVEYWRPVDAQHVGEDRYALSGPIPEDEVLEVQPGTTVRYREQTFRTALRSGWCSPKSNGMP